MVATFMQAELTSTDIRGWKWSWSISLYNWSNEYLSYLHRSICW